MVNDPVNRKVALAVRSDLAVWQRLNVTAFLTSGFGQVDTTLVGAPYVDADARSYTPMLAHPVRVFIGDGPALRRAFERAVERGLLVSVYTDDLFATMDDVANRGAVAAMRTSDLPLAGFAAAGAGRQVDKAFDKLRLHD